MGKYLSDAFVFREPFDQSRSWPTVGPWKAGCPAQHQGRVYQMFPFFSAKQHCGCLGTILVLAAFAQVSSANWYSPKPRGADVSPDQRALSSPCVEAFPKGWMSPDLLPLKAASILSPHELERIISADWSESSVGCLPSQRLHWEFAIWSSHHFRSEYHTDLGPL